MSQDECDRSLRQIRCQTVETEIHKWQLTNWMVCNIGGTGTGTTHILIMTHSPCAYLSSEEKSNWVKWASGRAKTKQKLWDSAHWPSKSSLPHNISSPDVKWVFHQSTSLPHTGQLWTLVSSPASKSTVSPGVGFSPLPSVTNSAKLSFLFQK